MYQNIRVKLLNLLLSLSDALDLASSQLSQHQLRTAFAAWEIGKVIRLSPDAENDLFVAALLHDLGALTPEDKLDIHQRDVEDPEHHCILGRKLLERVSIFENSSKIVRLHHTRWTDIKESGLNPITLSSQILNLADAIERSIDRQRFILHQDQELISNIISMKGDQFYPEIVEAFKSISVREDFWLDLTSSRLYSILLNNGPCRGIEIEVSHLLVISEMFRNMIDFRSRFTATHSSGVAAAASELSRAFGYTTTEVELMEVTGNLHDLGKMAIPNSILNKPGKLTGEESAIMRQHTYYTYAILTTIGGIQHIAEWAAFHHERLDGSGYPFHVCARELSINARIMAVADIFTALAEERPYRPSMSQPEVLKILKDLCERNWLDKSIVGILEDNYKGIVEITARKQAQTRSFFEQEFS